MQFGHSSATVSTLTCQISLCFYYLWFNTNYVFICSKVQALTFISPLSIKIRWKIICLSSDMLLVSKMRLFCQLMQSRCSQFLQSFGMASLSRILDEMMGRTGCRMMLHILRVSMVTWRMTSKSFWRSGIFLMSQGFWVSKNRLAAWRVTIMASTAR